MNEVNDVLPAEDEQTTHLQISRVKKIVKLANPELNANSQSVNYISCATELFIRQLARELAATAASQRRKTVQMRDFVELIDSSPWLDFLDGALDVAEIQQSNVTQSAAKRRKAAVDPSTTDVQDDSYGAVEDDSLVEDSMVEDTPASTTADDSLALADEQPIESDIAQANEENPAEISIGGSEDRSNDDEQDSFRSDGGE